MRLLFGMPLTYGNEQRQSKSATPPSCQLGDELMVINPGAARVNYVRDSLVFGKSYYPIPAWRVYGEAGWRLHPDGGGSVGVPVRHRASRLVDGKPRDAVVAIDCRLRKDEEVVCDVKIKPAGFAAAFWSDIAVWLRRLQRGVEPGAILSKLGKTDRHGLWYDFWAGQAVPDI